MLLLRYVAQLGWTKSDMLYTHYVRLVIGFGFLLFSAMAASACNRRSGLGDTRPWPGHNPLALDDLGPRALFFEATVQKDLGISITCGGGGGAEQ